MPKVKTKIDAAKKKKITQDWLAEFPSYKKFRPCAWKKRVGPLVFHMGYHLDRQGIEYEVGGSYFNLSNPLDFMCANLSFEAKTWHCLYITWEKHENGRYHQTAQELREEAPLPLEGSVTLSQVIQSYKNYTGSIYSSRHFEDPALIAAWAGRFEIAKECLEWGRTHYKTHRSRDPNESIEPWYQSMLTRISDPDALRKLVDEKVVQFKLTKVPYEALIIDL